MQLNQLSSPKIEFVVGNENDFDKIHEVKPLNIFAGNVCNFLNSLSQRLLKSHPASQFSDAITFAFWCRKASINKMSLPYMNENINSQRIGRGIAFHISPSNVPVNFAYSCVAGLLAGNINIVRLPSKHFEQVDIICDAINDIISKDFSCLNQYIYMIRYGHEKEINDLLSGLCDLRIIWGGDNTINTLRKSPLKVRANEITFSDRYSIMLIKADEYLASENKSKIAEGFYNDTYLTDQNACTAPKIIIWYGNQQNCKVAQKDFWQYLQEVIDKKYDMTPIQAVDKYFNLLLLSTQENVKWIRSDNNRITRVEVFDIKNSTMDFHWNSGFFVEYQTEDLYDIIPICGERCQTLSYFGIQKEELQNLLMTIIPKGIDRVVPLGRTLDFSLNWDGYDLIYSMSRVLTYL